MTVHHITPGKSDLNFGKAINDVIEFLPEEDWVCLRDIDTLPLHHRVFFKQCEDIAESGEYDLVSCVTNRLGVKYQLHDGKISDNFDIKHHLQIAYNRYDEYKSTVDEAPGNIAGVMMLFSKQTWEDVGRFKEGGVQVDGSFLDYLFSNKVKKIGGKIGVAKGIYLFHIYREWEENVRFGYNHILKNKQ
jgi:hypothetical protein